MKIRSGLMLAMSAMACWSMGSKDVQASEVLYSGVGFLQGSQSFTDSFSVSSPGTLTVTLGNIGWPQALSSLQLLVSDSGGKVGTMQENTMGMITDSFNVASGNVFAQWFGSATGPLNAGVYSLQIQFQPGGNPVPLPTSIALLISGMGLLIWQRRTRAPGAGRDLEGSEAATAA